MPDPESLLLAALRATPRRYRMPPLAPDKGPEGALASALERVRAGAADAAVRELFTQALATLVTQAWRSDPVLQAAVLRGQQAQVAEYAGLAAGEAADRRRVWTLVDAFAHPGKLRSLPDGHAREALARLHALARGEAWAGLRAHALALATPSAQAVLAAPALARLERLDALRQDPSVRRYLELCAAQGPVAGSDAALQLGHAAALTGEAVEAATLQAFATLARWMGDSHRAAGTLRPGTGFAPAAPGAKDEWDVALLHTADGSDAIVLLAECKAAPLAAASDWPRLLAGLRRLSVVEEGAVRCFTSSEGALHVTAGSLQALAPIGDAPPPQVFYACCAEERRIPLLAPAARTMLLQEPAAIAFARELAAGRSPAPLQLVPLFSALTSEPRLRPVLHQYETARRARAAMLHPDDLLAAAADAFGVDRQGLPRNR